MVKTIWKYLGPKVVPFGHVLLLRQDVKCDFMTNLIEIGDGCVCEISGL